MCVTFVVRQRAVCLYVEVCGCAQWVSVGVWGSRVRPCQIGGPPKLLCVHALLPDEAPTLEASPAFVSSFWKSNLPPLPGHLKAGTLPSSGCGTYGQPSLNLGCPSSSPRLEPTSQTQPEDMQSPTDSRGLVGRMKMRSGQETEKEPMAAHRSMRTTAGGEGLSVSISGCPACSWSFLVPVSPLGPWVLLCHSHSPSEHAVHYHA